MKYIAYIYLLICFLSCDKELDYYHGVVVDSNLVPISNVTVKTDYSDAIFTETKKTGYFKLSREPNKYGSIIFSKKGYKTDTIRTVWAQSGEFLDYNFINKKIDTIALREITLPNNGYK